MAKLSLQCNDELMREDVQHLLGGLIGKTDPRYLEEHHIPKEFIVEKERHFFMTFIRQLLEKNAYTPEEREEFWSEFFGTPAGDDMYEIFRRAIVKRGTKRDVAASCPSIHVDTINDVLHRIPPRYRTWKNVSNDLGLPVDTFGQWAKAYFEYLLHKKNRNEFGARMGTLFALQEGAVHSRWLEERPVALSREYITNTELSRLVARLQRGERPQTWELTDRVIHALGCGDPEWRLLTAQAWLKAALADEGTVAPAKIRASAPRTGRPIVPKKKTKRAYNPGLPYPESLAGQDDETIIAACAKAFAEHVGIEEYELEGEPTSAIDELLKKTKTRKRKPVAILISETDEPSSPDAAKVDETPTQESVEKNEPPTPEIPEAAAAERMAAFIGAFDCRTVPSFIALPRTIDIASLTDVQLIHVVDSIHQAVDDICRQSGFVRIPMAREAVFLSVGISEEEFSMLWRRYEEAKKGVSKQESKWISKWFEKYPDEHHRLAYVFGKIKEHGKLDEKQLSRTWVQFFDLDPTDTEAAYLFTVLERQREESEAVLDVLFERLREPFEQFIDQAPEPWMFDWLMSYSVIGRHFESATESTEDDDVDEDEKTSVYDFTEAMKFSLFQELWSRLDDPDKAIEEAHNRDFGQKQIVLAGTKMGLTIIARRISLGMNAFAIDIAPGIPVPALPRVRERAFDYDAAAAWIDAKFESIVAAISFQETQSDERDDEQEADEGEEDGGEQAADEGKEEGVEQAADEGKEEGVEQAADEGKEEGGEQAGDRDKGNEEERGEQEEAPVSVLPPMQPPPTDHGSAAVHTIHGIPSPAPVPTAAADIVEKPDESETKFTPEYIRQLEERLRREGKIQ